MCWPDPQSVATARCIAACPLAVAMAPHPAFERGDAFLQHRVGGVRDPRIDVPGPLGVEERGGLVSVAEHVG